LFGKPASNTTILFSFVPPCYGDILPAFDFFGQAADFVSYAIANTMMIPFQPCLLEIGAIPLQQSAS
jgi:hypothetical protein